MPHYFLDTSAIVKRYMAETGSGWIDALCRDVDNTIIISDITLVEAASTFARASRGLRITNQQRIEYLDLFTRDCDNSYQLFPVNRLYIRHAVALTQRYFLRGYDAVQLACASAANHLLVEQGLPQLTFIAADTDLISAATAEMLSAENPNDH